MARPKEFDPEVALEKATALFWAKGYFDTSIRDLVDETGVNYYGLYSTFEDKRGLFLQALDLYQNSVTRTALRELRGSGSLTTRVRRVLEVLLAEMQTESGSRGCLMANTAVELAPHDAEVAERVQQHLKLLRKEFRAALERGKADGDCALGLDVSALAEHLATTAYTLGMLKRAGCSQAYVNRHIDVVMSLLA
ncbi:MAG: TetR/AcrR family transcriptional regulator [Myxococcota bacterium]